MGVWVRLCSPSPQSACFPSGAGEYKRTREVKREINVQFNSAIVLADLSEEDRFVFMVKEVHLLIDPTAATLPRAPFAYPIKRSHSQQPG